MKSPKIKGVGEVVTDYGAKVMKVFKEGLLGRSLFDFYGDVKALTFRTKEVTTVPTTPPNGKGGVIYTKTSDGKLYYKSNEVAEVELSAVDTVLNSEQVQDIVGAMLVGTETRIGVSYDDTNGRINFVVDDMTANDNTQLTTEQVQDIVGGMLVGTETRIGVTYDDTNGRINFVVDDMTANDNTQLTTESVQDIVGAMFSSNTETRVSATYVDGGVGAGKINIAVDDMTANDNTQNTTTLSFVDSSNDILLRNTTGGAGSGTDDIKFVAGSNVTLTHTDADNITITSTDTNTQLSTEQVQDIAGPLVATGGTKTNIAVTYDDANGNMDFVVASDLDTTGQAGTVASIGNLTGDVTSSNRATTIAAAQTNITTITNDSLKIGRDADNLIEFDADNIIDFRVGGGDVMRLNMTQFRPTTNNTMRLGTGTIAFADLFLGDGAVINFNNGDVLLTHSSNLLTLTGGNLDVPLLETDNITIAGAQGTDGQVLTSTGSGVAWEDAASGGGSGDITAVVAGTGLNGGATSGSATLNIDAAQTGINSILATDLVLGEDAQTKIDFGTVNQINIVADNTTVQNITSTTITNSVANFNITSGSASSPSFTLLNTSNDTSGSNFIFKKDKGAAAANNDILGTISFVGDDSGQNVPFETYATIVGSIATAAHGSEGGKLTFNLASHDGETQPGLILADGSAEDEIDVTIGNGAASVVTASGTLTANSIQIPDGSEYNGSMQFQTGSTCEFLDENDNPLIVFSNDGITSLIAAGNLDIGAHQFRALSFTSDVSTGTAPFVVSSTTPVANLQAATATILHTARNIGGVSFNGSANIDLPGVNSAGNQNTSGTATNATNSAHVLVTDNESTNEENLITFVEGATSATGNVGLEMDGHLTYNPSTGTVTATVFKGNIDAVDIDVDGTLETDNITIGGAQGTDGQVLTSTGSGVAWEDAASGGSSSTSHRELLNCGFNDTSTTKGLFPFGHGGLSDVGASASLQEFTCIVAPYDGYVDYVVVRCTGAAGTTAITFHKRAAGTAGVSATGNHSVNVSVSANTAVKAVFGETNGAFSAGDIIATGYDTGSAGFGDTVATMSIVYDLDTLL